MTDDGIHRKLKKRTYYPFCLNEHCHSTSTGLHLSIWLRVLLHYKGLNYSNRSCSFICILVISLSYSGWIYLNLKWPFYFANFCSTLQPGKGAVRHSCLSHCLTPKGWMGVERCANQPHLLPMSSLAVLELADNNQSWDTVQFRGKRELS